MIGIKAGGGVVCRKREHKQEVLLIYRRGVWDLPKGKQEEGEAIKACARREVAEETGIPLPQIEHFITHTFHEYERDGKRYKKQTSWYVMQTAAEGAFTPEEAEGITKVQWVGLNEAKEKVGYHNLRKVLSKIKPV